MLVPEFYRDSFDLVPRPPRFAPTAPGAFRFAFDNDYANKHSEHKTAIGCPDGRWFNNNLAQHGAALSEKSFGTYTICRSVCLQSGPYEKRASVGIDPVSMLHRSRDHCRGHKVNFGDLHHIPNNSFRR